MSAAGQALVRFWWYVREVFGETAYDHYIAHHQQHCPTGPMLTRREFERLKNKPNIRCC